MGKKISANSKAEAAKAAKEAKAAESSAKAAKASEDKMWQDAGEGKKSKAQAKKADEAKRKEEAAAKKLEAKKLAEKEEADLAAREAKKAGKAAGPKVTHHALKLQAEAERRQQEEEAQKQRLRQRREAGQDDYAAIVDVANANRDPDALEARSLDAALSALSTGDAKEDKHPEKRAKAAWNAYYEAQLPEARAEKPGLKLQQYREMIWKTWQKHPSNPMLAARALDKR